jgi:hypothetical protein
MVELMKALGRTTAPFDKTRHYKKLMEDAGFINVQESICRITLNDENRKDISEHGRVVLYQGLEALSLLALRKILNWSKEEFLVLLAHAGNQTLKRETDGFWPLVCIIGQNPYHE